MPISCFPALRVLESRLRVESLKHQVVWDLQLSRSAFRRGSFGPQSASTSSNPQRTIQTHRQEELAVPSLWVGQRALEEVVLTAHQAATT